MSDNYEEIVEGETLLRASPGARHETICVRLHSWVSARLAPANDLKLLSARSVVQLSPGTMIRPDLALVSSTAGKLWLAAEIIHAGDHRTDTVVKKTIYEDHRVPRLWMIDPRYDNVEVYEDGEYGLTLREILAGREVLKERLLPEFEMVIEELFKLSE
jgi:hypothetical protein